jgi:hypothetical protein
MLPCVPRFRIPPPSWGALRCCHVFYSSRPISLSGRAPAVPHVPRFQTSPPSWEGLQCCHVSHSFGPTSLLRRTPTLSRVPCPVALEPPPCWRGLQRCHVSRDFLRVAVLKYKGSHYWLNRAFKTRAFPRRTCLTVLQCR